MSSSYFQFRMNVKTERDENTTERVLNAIARAPKGFIAEDALSQKCPDISSREERLESDLFIHRGVGYLDNWDQTIIYHKSTASLIM